MNYSMMIYDANLLHLLQTRSQFDKLISSIANNAGNARSIILNLKKLTDNILTDSDYKTIDAQQYEFDKVLLSFESSIEYLKLLGFTYDENDDNRHLMQCTEDP